MQKWEYLNLVTSSEHWHSLRDIKKCKGFIEGFSQYKDVFDELPEAFLDPMLRPKIANQLGELGWELVSGTEKICISKGRRRSFASS